MKDSTTTLPDILRLGSFQKWYEADVWYDGEVRLSNVPITNVQITEDESRAIKAQGGCTLVWTDDYGQSILPVSPGDLFAPFGCELAIFAVISVGSNVERIPMGWFQIVDVPTMRDQTMFFSKALGIYGGLTLTSGSVLELRFMDRMIQVSNDKFDVPSAPSQLTSVWDEIARLTGLQVDRSPIADAAISRNVVYEEEKLDAVLDLADILGGIPYMAPDGTLTMRTKVWPAAAVDTLRRGDTGTIVDIGKGMSSDQIYNTVVFRGQDAAQGTVLARAEILEGALRVRNDDGGRSPAHRRVTFRSNPFVTTNAQAQTYVNSELARVSSLRAVQWPIQEIWNPLREVGDVVNVVDEQGTTVLCRIQTISRDEGATQELGVVRG